MENVNLICQFFECLAGLNFEGFLEYSNAQDVHRSILYLERLVNLIAACLRNVYRTLLSETYVDQHLNVNYFAVPVS